MSTGRHASKQTDAARLMRAAADAGLKVKGITIRNGKPYLEIEDGESDADRNPFDAEADKLRKDPT